MKIESTSATAPQSAHAAALHFPYRPDIDGLRAVAVLAVVLFHAFPALLPGGFVGVDVFFVISGFLISGILLLELEHGAFSVAGFYARRIKRIFPALLAVMAACLAFGWYALFPDEYQQLGKHVVGGSSFAANLFYWEQVGYFDTGAYTKPLLHLWSLGVEEQFYIVWPVVLLAAWRWRSRLLAVTLVLALASFALNVGGMAHHATASFYSPGSRAWELLAGAMLAIAAHRGALASVPARLANPASLAGIAILAASLALTSEKHFPGWPALAPVLGAVLLIGAGPRATFNRLVLGNPVMVGIGLISYPLYLWHWPLLAYAHIVESNVPAPSIRAGAIGAAVVLAWVSYELLEKPVRRAGKRRGKTVVGLLFALMAGMLALGAWIFEHEGLPQRRPVQDNLVNQKLLVVPEDKPNSAACKKRYGFDEVHEFCMLAHVDRDPTVALVGDSHAYHIAFGFRDYYEKQGENLLLLGTRFPYWNFPVQDDPYQKATQPMLEIAMNTPSIKTVIISSHVRYNTKPGQHIFFEGARDTYRRFLAAGKHLIVIEDVPNLPFDPRSCIKRAGVASSATTWPCAISREAWDKQIAEHESFRRQLEREFPQIEWFRTSDALCDADSCRAMIDNHLMYRDDNHLSYEGDLRVGSYYAKRPAWHPPK